MPQNYNRAANWRELVERSKAWREKDEKDFGSPLVETDFLYESWGEEFLPDPEEWIAGIGKQVKKSSVTISDLLSDPTAMTSLLGFTKYQERLWRNQFLLNYIMKCRQSRLSFTSAGRSLFKAAVLGDETYYFSREITLAREWIRKYMGAWGKVFQLLFREMGYPGDFCTIYAEAVRLYNGKMIHVKSSNKDSARGVSGDIILDEFATHEDQKGLFEAAASCTENGFQLFIITTPENAEDFSWQLYTEAQRDPNWYTEDLKITRAIDEGLRDRFGNKPDLSMIASRMGEGAIWAKTGKPGPKMAKNYFTTPTGSGDCVFDVVRLGQMHEIASKIPETARYYLTDLTGNYNPKSLLSRNSFEYPPFLQVWQEPEPGHKYVIGCDVSHGVLNRDETAISVADFETGEVVAEFNAFVNATETACWLVAIGAYYNFAYLVVEANGHGIETMDWLLTFCVPGSNLTRYPNVLLYVDVEPTKGKSRKRYGFITGDHNRDLVYGNLIAKVADPKTFWPNPETIGQCYYLIQLPGGKIQARNKGQYDKFENDPIQALSCRDDRMTAKALMYEGIKSAQTRDPWAAFTDRFDNRTFACYILQGKVPPRKIGQSKPDLSEWRLGVTKDRFLRTVKPV